MIIERNSVCANLIKNEGTYWNEFILWTPQCLDLCWLVILGIRILEVILTDYNCIRKKFLDGQVLWLLVNVHKLSLNLDAYEIILEDIEFEFCKWGFLNLNKPLTCPKIILKLYSGWFVTPWGKINFEVPFDPPPPVQYLQNKSIQGEATLVNYRFFFSS